MLFPDFLIEWLLTQEENLRQVQAGVATYGLSSGFIYPSYLPPGAVVVVWSSGPLIWWSHGSLVFWSAVRWCPSSDPHGFQTPTLFEAARACLFSQHKGTVRKGTDRPVIKNLQFGKELRLASHHMFLSSRACLPHTAAACGHFACQRGLRFPQPPCCFEAVRACLAACIMTVPS